LRKISQAGTFLRAMGRDGASDKGGRVIPKGPSPAAFAGAGFELAGCILLGLFAGQWVDKRLGTAPWLLILGVFAGAAAGFFNMYRILTTAERRTKSHDDVGTSPPSKSS
jgi:Putative F0F1-ATPase subunit Ca2+/Mg2+ transporter